MRIGHGYDVHRFAPNRKLILGGVSIPHEYGLDGHSDTDVLAHAMMDALLGAAGLGDIGKLFPDNDDAFLNADSMMLLSRVVALIHENGYRISNMDSTVIAQVPKLSPYIQQMRERVSAALDIPLDCVSIKATTEEGLGFTGQKLGIAAHAVTLLE